jgi:hypothetical protein
MTPNGGPTTRTAVRKPLREHGGVPPSGDTVSAWSRTLATPGLGTIADEPASR